MEHDDSTDSIIKQFANINVEYDITDTQLLETLNELRLQEGRQSLSELPIQFVLLKPTQKKTLHERLLNDIRIHNHLQEDYQTQDKPYPKVLLLNRTEQLLLGINRQAPNHPQIENLCYEEVTSQDRKLYYPNDEDKEKKFSSPTHLYNSSTHLHIQQDLIVL